LYSTDPAHITDVTIVTDLDGDTGVVDYTIDAEGDRRCRDQSGAAER
jgi:hypothetical protein